MTQVHLLKLSRCNADSFPKMAVKPYFQPTSSMTTYVDVFLSPSPCPLSALNLTGRTRLQELDFSPFKKDTNMLLAATSSRSDFNI